MKLIEKFSRIHHQEKKLEEILEQPHNEKWLICYLSHYDYPHFSVFQKGTENISKSVVFKLVEVEFVYVKSTDNVNYKEIKEAQKILNQILKTVHNDWTEVLI